MYLKTIILFSYNIHVPLPHAIISNNSHSIIINKTHVLVFVMCSNVFEGSPKSSSQLKDSELSIKRFHNVNQLFYLSKERADMINDSLKDYLNMIY